MCVIVALSIQVLKPFILGVSQMCGTWWNNLFQNQINCTWLYELHNWRMIATNLDMIYAIAQWHCAILWGNLQSSFVFCSLYLIYFILCDCCFKFSFILNFSQMKSRKNLIILPMKKNLRYFCHLFNFCSLSSLT